VVIISENDWRFVNDTEARELTAWHSVSKYGTNREKRQHQSNTGKGEESNV